VTTLKCTPSFLIILILILFVESLIALEKTAREIKTKQDELSRKRRVVFAENHSVLHDLTQEIDSLDEQLRQTKTRIKKLISQLRHIAKKEHVSIVEEKKERLHIDRWITKKDICNISYPYFIKCLTMKLYCPYLLLYRN